MVGWFRSYIYFLYDSAVSSFLQVSTGILLIIYYTIVLDTIFIIFIFITCTFCVCIFFVHIFCIYFISVFIYLTFDKQ